MLVKRTYHSCTGRSIHKTKVIVTSWEDAALPWGSHCGTGAPHTPTTLTFYTNISYIFVIARVRAKIHNDGLVCFNLYVHSGWSTRRLVWGFFSSRLLTRVRGVCVMCGGGVFHSITNEVSDVCGVCEAREGWTTPASSRVLWKC